MVTHSIPLSPQGIHDAAAALFWTLVATYGYAPTKSRAREEGAAALLGDPVAIAALVPYGINALPPEARSAIALGIAADIDEAVARNRDLAGTIYAEDAKTGRAPSAQDIDASQVAFLPRSFGGAESLPRAGHLCLRHPLPAVVFNDAPVSGPFLVADTSAGIGFSIPLILTSTVSVQVSPALYAITGTFFVPVPTAEIGAKWGGVLANSVRYFRRATILTAGAEIIVEAGW